MVEAVEDDVLFEILEYPGHDALVLVGRESCEVVFAVPMIKVSIGVAQVVDVEADRVSNDTHVVSARATPHDMIE